MSTLPGFSGVIDLSHHQRAIDWQMVRDAGIVAVIHKATEGATFRDPAYVERREAARAVGLLWGSYHYAGTAPVADQVANYLAHADPGAGDLVCLDYEPQPSGAIMTPSDLVALAEAVHARLGRWPLLYGGEALVAAAAGQPSLACCPLWLARYGDVPPESPPPWNRWTLWQYTDGTQGPEPSSVPGIGACDRNVFDGTEAELRRACPFGV